MMRRRTLMMGVSRARLVARDRCAAGFPRPRGEDGRVLVRVTGRLAGSGDLAEVVGAAEVRQCRRACLWLGVCLPLALCRCLWLGVCIRCLWLGVCIPLASCRCLYIIPLLLGGATWLGVCLPLALWRCLYSIPLFFGCVCGLVSSVKQKEACCTHVLATSCTTFDLFCFKYLI